MTVCAGLQSTIQLVAIDLDGTLLDSRHRLSDRNHRALTELIRQGVEIVLATGKTRNSSLQLIKQLGIRSPGIYMQGLITYNADGSVRRRQVMCRHVAQRVTALGETRGFRAILYSDNCCFSLKPDAVTSRLSDYGEPPAQQVASWRCVLENYAINKVILYAEEQAVGGMRAQLDQSLSGEVHVTRANIRGMIEVLPRDASKGHSLKVLMEEMGIPPQRAMAFGDGENDTEMLKNVGLGIAMGNAVQKLKDAADYVAPSNDDDGVAVALEKFVLGSKESYR